MRRANSGWRTSARSGQSGDNCVEVALTDESVAVRDSTDRSGPVLVFGRNEWRAFLRETKSGAFDPR